MNELTVGMIFTFKVKLVKIIEIDNFNGITVAQKSEYSSDFTGMEKTISEEEIDSNFKNYVSQAEVDCLLSHDMIVIESEFKPGDIINGVL
jgi:Icc-related predicted phosphoesterase